jgi:4-hydroxybenzoate polyprenyltransferase
MSGYLKALRPVELLIYALALAVSVHLSAGSHLPAAILSPGFLIALISVALLYGGGNIIGSCRNPSSDSAPDTGGKKEFVKAALTIGAAILMALFCGLRFFSGSLLIGALLLIYGRYRKAPCVFRRFFRALTGSMVFILGPLLSGTAGLSLYCLPVAFLFIVSRETVRDIEDRDAGDEQMPIRPGVTKAFMAAALCIATGLALTVIYYCINPFSRLFLTFLSFAILIFLIGIIFVFVREAGTFRRYIEMTMLLLLLGAMA